MIDTYADKFIKEDVVAEVFYTNIYDSLIKNKMFLNAFYPNLSASDILSELKEVSFDNCYDAVIEDTISLLQKRACQLTLIFAELEELSSEDRVKKIELARSALPKIKIPTQVIERASLTVTILDNISKALEQSEPNLAMLLSNVKSEDIIFWNQRLSSNEFMLTLYHEYIAQFNTSSLSSEMVGYSDDMTYDLYLKIKVIESIENRIFNKLRNYLIQNNQESINLLVESLGIYKDLRQVDEENIEVIVVKAMTSLLEA